MLGSDIGKEIELKDRKCCRKGLVTNYGEEGLQNGRGGACEVLPLRKGVGGKGGHNKFWGSF